MGNIFAEISLVVVLAGLLGICMHLLRQPAIIGYILTGLIVGPLGYLHLDNAEILNSLSEIGITLLLFMVGLELSLKDVKEVGWTAIIVGLLQILIVGTFSAFVFTFFGLPPVAVFYLALGVAISSTIVAVKILSEKRDLDSLSGKLVLGILIIEDIVSIIALALISGVSAQTTISLAPIILVVLKLMALFVLTIVASKHIFPWIVERMARSGELIFLFSLAWGLGFATLISDRLFGLTPEIGGFLAGLTLANTYQHLQIASRMKPLRDFFLILFFIVLGSRLVIDDLASAVLAALGIVAIGVLVKPAVTFILLSILGYRGRTSFITASSLAHISEFSIILAVLGFRAGHISEELLSLITLSTIISFILASYLVYNNQHIAMKLRGFFRWWDPRAPKRELSSTGRSMRGHIILIGAHRTGQSILHSLEEMHKKFMVIDFNPAIVRKFRNRGIYTLFGDISDPDIQENANIDKAKIIISTVPDFQDTLSLLETVKNKNSRAKLIVYGNNDLEAEKLYAKGADYVLMPHFLGGMQLAELLKKDNNLKSIDKLKKRDLQLIEETG